MLRVMPIIMPHWDRARSAGSRNATTIRAYNVRVRVSVKFRVRVSVKFRVRVRGRGGLNASGASAKALSMTISPPKR